jgi:hypothetical protein
MQSITVGATNAFDVTAKSPSSESLNARQGGLIAINWRKKIPLVALYRDVTRHCARLDRS